MAGFLTSAADRLRLYAQTQRIDLSTRLGDGMDGLVVTTRGMRRTAIKVHERLGPFLLEVESYQRLHGVRNICGHAVPQLLGSKAELGVIEMEIVSPPFLLDFGKVRLDEPSELHWPEHVLEARWAHWESLFEPGQWSTVLTIYDELAERFGIWLEDLHPGNIAFDPRQPPAHA